MFLVSQYHGAHRASTTSGASQSDLLASTSHLLEITITIGGTSTRASALPLVRKASAVRNPNNSEYLAASFEFMKLTKATVAPSMSRLTSPSAMIMLDNWATTGFAMNTIPAIIPTDNVCARVTNTVVKPPERAEIKATIARMEPTEGWKISAHTPCKI